MLRTECNKCVFLESDNCNIGKPIFTDEAGSICTKGFCRHKRLNGKIEEITLEENKISLIILSKDNNIDDINKTIVSVLDYADFIKQIIVVLNNAEKNKQIETMEALIKHNVLWNLENSLLDKDTYIFNLIDIGSKSVVNSWFLPIVAGDSLKHSEIECIKKYFQDTMDNFLCIIFDKNDPLKVVLNKFAFKDLFGNIGEPCFDKIKRFNDWESVCKQIN